MWQGAELVRKLVHAHSSTGSVYLQLGALTQELCTLTLHKCTIATSVGVLDSVSRRERSRQKEKG